MDFGAIWASLPQEVKDQIREGARKKFKNEEDILKFMEFEEDLEVLNTQLCQTFSMMKAILSRFNENATSTDHALDNFRFYAKFITIMSLPLRNLGENMNAFHDKYGPMTPGNGE